MEKIGEDITLIRRVAPAMTAWGSEAFIIWKAPSNERVLLRFGKTADGALARFILVDGWPVLTWLSVANGGPALMCPYPSPKGFASVAASGHGAAGPMPAPIANLAGALETGLYMISAVPHYPVDISGRFFWRGASEMEYSRLDQSAMAGGHPLYITPSRLCTGNDANDFNGRAAARDGISHNAARPAGPASATPVPRACVNAAPGETVCNGAAAAPLPAKRRALDCEPGLAIYFDDFTSVVIDGHRRAAEAFARGERVPLWTVIPCSGYKFTGSFPTHAYFTNYAVPLFELPETMIDKSSVSGTRFRIPTEEVEQLLGRSMDAVPAGIYIADNDCSAQMPDNGSSTRDASGSDDLPASFREAVHPLAAASCDCCYPGLWVHERVLALGGIDEAAIAGLAEDDSGEGQTRKEMLLELLALVNGPRAFRLACEYALLERHSAVWEKAYGYLAGFRTPEVDEIFVKFIVRDDGAFPEVREIVDRYYE